MWAKIRWTPALGIATIVMIAASPQRLAAQQPEAAPCAGIPVKIGGADKCLKAGDSFHDADGAPEVVIIPAGSFTMGSPATEKNHSDTEAPQHDVTIAKPFALGKYEVTRGQFAAFVKATGHDTSGGCFSWDGEDWTSLDDRSWRAPGFDQDDSHPAACISWNDATAYVAWLSKETRQAYRLPSEAEFEYAARGQTRAGTYPRFWYGDSEESQCASANGADATTAAVNKKITWTIACSDGFAFTAPVGSFAANAFGLHDMAGNVWQWTADCYEDSYNGAPGDGSSRTTSSCEKHVLRSGSWFDDPGNFRAAKRVSEVAVYRANEFSFRIARTL